MIRSLSPREAYVAWRRWKCLEKLLGTPGVTTVTLRLTAVVVEGQAYRVSAGAVRIEPPNSSTSRSQAHRAQQLSAGTCLVFRLVAPLLVTRS